MKKTFISKQPPRHDINSLAKVLDHIDPDVAYDQWVRALMAVYYETRGSKEGLELAEAWSSRGRKYCGAKRLRGYWRNFRSDLDKPITLATLIWMAKRAYDK